MSFSHKKTGQDWQLPYHVLREKAVTIATVLCGSYRGKLKIPQELMGQLGWHMQCQTG